MKKLFTLTSCAIIGLSSLSWALSDSEFEQAEQTLRRAFEAKDDAALQPFEPDYDSEPQIQGILAYAEPSALEGRIPTDAAAFLRIAADSYFGGLLEQDGFTKEEARGALLDVDSDALRVTKVMIQAEQTGQSVPSQVDDYGLMMFQSRLWPSDWLSQDLQALVQAQLKNATEDAQEGAQDS